MSSQVISHSLDVVDKFAFTQSENVKPDFTSFSILCPSTMRLTEIKSASLFPDYLHFIRLHLLSQLRHNLSGSTLYRMSNAHSLATDMIKFHENDNITSDFT